MGTDTERDTGESVYKIQRFKGESEALANGSVTRWLVGTFQLVARTGFSHLCHEDIPISRYGVKLLSWE